jgi:hypothetical protein
MTALWIIGCTSKKNDGERAACTKYDARQHRVLLDLFWQYQAPCGDDLAILSAEFGLVPAAKPVRDYDRKMDGKRAAEIAADPAQLAELADLLAGKDEIYLYGGRSYRACIQSMLAALGADVDVIEIVGDNRGCGDHFSELCAMLRESEEMVWGNSGEHDQQNAA